MTAEHLLYKECIEACLKCAEVCDNSAYAFSRSEDFATADCTRLTIECAAICYNAARYMASGSAKKREISAICAFVCEQCANACAEYDNTYCKRCVQTCLNCVEECRKMGMSMAA